MIKFKNKGVSRLVLLVGGIAIKVPNLTCNHSNFLKGCNASWNERQYTKSFKGLPEFLDKVTPTLFCSWFGLISIQKRVVELQRDLTEYEKHEFRHQTSDIKKENFGHLNGRLVCIDYAN